MAPAKGAKRAGQAKAAPDAKKQKAAAPPEPKKPKLDPLMVGVMEGIKQAEDLPEDCREMLTAMVPNCFGTPASKRHESQAMVVSWIGEVLNGVRVKLQESHDAATSHVAGAGRTKEDLDSRVAEAKAALAASQEALVAREAAVSETAQRLEALRGNQPRAQDAPEASAPEGALRGAEEVQKAAVSARDVAQAERQLREADLVAAEAAVKAFAKTHGGQATSAIKQKEEALQNFTAHNLECFNMLRDKAAPAGA